jgi:uncharacterized protein
MRREVLVPLQALAACAIGGAACQFLRTPLPRMIGPLLATAPGGIAEMCITAKVLQLGVPLVTVAHVTRVLILVTTTAPLFRFAKRLSANSA